MKDAPHIPMTKRQFHRRTRRRLRAVIHLLWGSNDCDMDGYGHLPKTVADKLVAALQLITQAEAELKEKR